MQYRPFARTGLSLSEIGYGMWGMGGWSGSDEKESLRSLDRAVSLGCTFFDTAWAYGQGLSERLLGRTLRAHPGARLIVATKIPPKNGMWPARVEYTLDEVFPADHIREYTARSLENLGVSSIDLQQFHVWNDRWAENEGWQTAIADLRREGLIKSVGISVNRWEPWNVLKTLETGLVDSVQVVYNIFDQAPEDDLFPACQRLGVAVIARVPFDEGSLTGTFTPSMRWPEGDWRNVYFTPENLARTLERVASVECEVPQGMTLPELALRFILEHPAVTTTIPGMRRIGHVERNLATSDGARLPATIRAALKKHRWDRTMVIP